MPPIFWATNTFACYVKASESLKLGKVVFFFFFFYNPRVNIKQTAFMLSALKKKEKKTEFEKPTSTLWGFRKVSFGWKLSGEAAIL